MSKKDFKGVASTYFTENTKFPKQLSQAQVAPIPPKAPKASITPIAPVAPKTTKRLNLYIDESLVADIKKIAGLKSKSVNSLICEVLTEHVKQNSEAIKIYNNYQKSNQK